MSLPLVEKYRPKKLDDLVIDPDLKKKIEEFIDSKDIPHLLLHGPPGTGKTTVAKILINSIIENRQNVLILNASDDRSIDTIRERVAKFISIKPLNPDKFRIVYFEEIASDNGGLTLAAQSALLNYIEDSSDKARFICTTNFPNKMLPALRSRFVSFKFDTLPKPVIKERLINILNSENINYDDKDLDKIIDTCYPNMRTMIQIIDKCIIKTENRLSSSLLTKSLLETYYLDKEEFAKNFIIFLWKHRKTLSEETLRYLPLVINNIADVSIGEIARYIDKNYTEMDLLELIVDMKRKNQTTRVIDIIAEIIKQSNN